MKDVANIASSIVFVALIMVLVTNKNTSTVINSLGSVFSTSLKTAEGTSA